MIGQVVIGELSAGNKSAPAQVVSGSLASIACGSELDLVEIDGLVLGVGGLVPISPSSTITAKLRSRLSDADGVWENIRDGNGNVVQVHDSVELSIWGPGEVPVPARRRANKVVHAVVPFEDVPQSAFGANVGVLAIRTGCAGRQRATLWLGQPELSPAGTCKVLVRTRRAGLYSVSAGGPGASANMMNEQIITPAWALSVISVNSGYCEPIPLEITGAVDIEVYLGQQDPDTSDGFWQVSLELEDPGR